MPTVTIKPSGKTQVAAEGSILIDAIIAAGEPIEVKCNRDAKCESCHVFILEGKKSLAKMGRPESEKLDSMVGVASKSRLACQCVLGTENVTVELLGALSG
ncbi:2Fe-2S iron-sulfur cluster-binding protein [Beijerinckia indica]|uniref:Ferredoxin n=1 Tax=Beijerinckia indica subsp. indica (strain ATCC 9039 / DSM 1715 / NCIMB 8712) TaxID=395963 RepID=B2IED1_BEII9|nr:2Fe-2S iron-sulfur cluster-binding protein [Beijerinckia indica]ACB95529.1 ferredoxin [Beijerinckia indica subsp. indica ATCC 9039]